MTFREVPERVRLAGWCGLFAAVAFFGGGCAHKTLAVPASVIEDTRYLTQLGLMRGHLLVGHALFALGEHQAAQSHAKHPSDELYADVAASFEARGVAGFAAELEAHANAMAMGKEAAVEDAYQALLAAIGDTEAVVDVPASLAGAVVAALLREAAREYDIGIVDGQLENAHEYQDAYGFTQVALALARRHHAQTQRSETDRELFRQISSEIQALQDLWPALMPPPRLETSGSRIDAAAAVIDDLLLRRQPAGRFR